MSKTAKEVITEQLYTVTEDAGYHQPTEILTDEIIAALDAAGFVIVPKDDHVLAVIKEPRWTGEKLEALADRINKHATAEGGVSNLSVLDRHLLCTLLRSIAASQESKS